MKGITHPRGEILSGESLDAKRMGALCALAWCGVVYSFLSLGRYTRTLAVLMVLIGSCEIAVAAPTVLTYQAKLTTGTGASITSPVSITFSFWDAPVGGTQLGCGLLGGGAFSFVYTATPDPSGNISIGIGDWPYDGLPFCLFMFNPLWLNTNVDGTDLAPRQRVTTAAYALNALSMFGAGYVTAEVTTTATMNGANLIAAYNTAKTLKPHGHALSATNRAMVLVAPGRYDVGTSEVLLDTDFVDLIGLSTSRDNQYIFGVSNGPLTGVLHQVANDVRIENLAVHCAYNVGFDTYTSGTPAAYFPEPGTTDTVMTNCAFTGDLSCWSTRLGIDYPGTYTDCKVESYGFGGYGGEANGTFSRCTGADGAFGAGYGAIASGNFQSCTGGFGSFGGGPSGGVASGTFTNCTADGNSFGGTTGQLDPGVASGTFTNCAGGEESFGGLGVASGTFTNCTGGENSFGSAGTASGLFTSCSGGGYAFGGANPVFNPGNASNGRFYYCSGAANSFTTSGTLAPVFRYCLQNGVAFP